MTRAPAMACAAFLLALPLCAQAPERRITLKELPPRVLAAYRRAFPKATLKGVTEAIDGPEARYGIVMVAGKSLRELVYRPDGTVAQVVEDLPIAKLPAAVVNRLRTGYPGATPAKAVRITAGGAIRYAVFLDTAKGKVKLDLDASGTVLHEALT